MLVLKLENKEKELSVGDHGYRMRNGSGNRWIEFAECENMYIINELSKNNIRNGHGVEQKE